MSRHLNELTGAILPHTVSLRTNLNIDSTKLAGVDSWHLSKCATIQTCNASISLMKEDEIQKINFTFSNQSHFRNRNQLTSIVQRPSPNAAMWASYSWPLRFELLSVDIWRTSSWNSRWCYPCYHWSIRVRVQQWKVQFGRRLCSKRNRVNCGKFSKMFSGLPTLSNQGTVQSMPSNCPSNQLLSYDCGNICRWRRRKKNWINREANQNWCLQRLTYWIRCQVRPLAELLQYLFAIVQR